MGHIQEGDVVISHPRLTLLNKYADRL